MKFILLLPVAAVLTVSAGCKSMEKVLRPPEREKSRTQIGEVQQTQRHRSPTDILPFKSNDTPAPSMLDSELNSKERALLKKYRQEGDITPRELDENKKTRNWVFGY